MKIYLLVLPLLSLLPVRAQAQNAHLWRPTLSACPTTLAPLPSQIPPTARNQAMSLLDKSAAAYAALEGLSMKYISHEEQNGKISDEVGILAFEKLGGVRITNLKTGSFSFAPSLTTSDAKAAKKSLAAAMEGAPGGLSLPMSFLAQGKNPLRAEMPEVGSVWRNIRLSPNGSVTATLRSSSPLKPSRYDLNWTFYFDQSDCLLRRIEVKAQIKGKPFVNLTTISDVQLNPQFGAGTFAAPVEVAEKKRDFHDPRLVVGTMPFPLTGTDLAGKTSGLGPYKGKVVLLDFWATWCGPCVGEMPNVLSNYKKYHAQGLEIVGVSLDEDKKALSSFVAARKIPWSQLFDGKGWKNDNAIQYGVKAIPFMLLIGKDGHIAAVNPRGKELEPALKAALSR